MTSEGLREMFEGDSGDTCTGKFPLMLMGGQVDGLACADLGARTPIGMSGKLTTGCPIQNLTPISLYIIFENNFYRSMLNMGRDRMSSHSFCV